MLTLQTDVGPLELEPLKLTEDPGDSGPVFTVTGGGYEERRSELVTGAALTAFRMGENWVRGGASRQGKPAPAAFVERTGLLRVAYRQIVIRFRRGVAAGDQNRLLADYGFERWRPEVHAPDERELRVFDPNREWFGQGLIEVANTWAKSDAVEFATPNFVFECRRSSPPAMEIDHRQLHLLALNANATWEKVRGKGIVASVLDDGVDVGHPSFGKRIFDPSSVDRTEPRDTMGRDYFAKGDDPEHFDPRPKLLRATDWKHSDYHGTPCAGLVAANGFEGVFGIAPECAILPVKVFRGDILVEHNRLSRAIRYATKFGDVLCCSWNAPYSPDVARAIADTATGRGGKGSVLFAAAGNYGANSLDFPASSPTAVAVGACTSTGAPAKYSNAGERLSVVVTSGERVDDVDSPFTTDVRDESPSRKSGISKGIFTRFGMTSAANALAAGVGALVLSANPELTAEEVRQILQDTADKVGGVTYDASGHNRTLGHGRVNAEAAVAEARKRSRRR